MHQKSVHPSIFDCIGDTPLVPVSLRPGGPVVHCKLEYMNPSGSVKDRIARAILQNAWRRGEIDERTTIVEASSGSTSIALAHACCHMGLHFKAVLPAGASLERRLTIMAHGGEVETVPDDAGMDAARERACQLGSRPGFFYADQFKNPDNWKAHAETADEILRALPKPDMVVSGIGTGGTLVGAHRRFREKGLDVRPVVARIRQPITYLLSIGFTCPGFDCHYLDLLREDRGFADRVTEVEVDEFEAIDCMFRLWERGFPVGPASAVNFLAAAKALGGHTDPRTAVTIFTDRLERYFSTQLVDRLKEKVQRQIEAEKRNALKNELRSEILAEIRSAYFQENGSPLAAPRAESTPVGSADSAQL
jgi:cysteine synthase A